MKKFLNVLGNYFEAVPDQLKRKRWIVRAGFLALFVFLAMGLPKNKFDMSLDSWFSKTDPTKLALNHFKDLFGSDDVVYLVYKPKDGDLFSANSLRAVDGIREEILNFREGLEEGETSMLQHVTRVDTLTSAKILQAKEGTLISRRFINKNYPTTESEKAALKKQAMEQRSFPLFYFSENYEYGAIVIQTDLGTERVNNDDDMADFEGEPVEFEESLDVDPELSDQVEEGVVEFKSVDMNEYTKFMDDLRKVILQPKYTEQLEYHPVGNPATMDILMRQMDEAGIIFMAMLAVIILLLWFLFHSLSAVIWSTLIVVISSVCTLGVSGWVGSTLTSMVSLTMLLILAVGVADAVHIISGYLFFRKEKLDHETAMRAAYRKAALPCLLTTITTMIGMLTLTLSSISHIGTFGYMSAIGVGFAFLLTLFLLPMLLDIWAPVSKKPVKKAKRSFIPDASVLTQNVLGKALPITEKSPATVIGIFLLVFITCIYGSTQVKIDSNLVDAVKEGTELRISYEIVDNNMAGTQTMEIFIDGGFTDSLLNPELLKTMDSFQQEIEGKYDHLVARTYSLANVVKEAYQVLNDGDESYYKLPEDATVLTQTLFMFNNANPEDRSRLVSDDYQKTHISVQLYNAGSYEYTDFFNQVQKDMDAAFAQLQTDNSDMEVSITGSLALLMKLADYIGWSQIKSLGSVILIISIIMVFIFGSARVGVMSIIPNLIPACLTFGLIGLLGLSLDSDTIVIAPVIIGIAVDDTIHFITHYRNEVLIDGNIRKALVSTIQEVGQAIAFTTLILGLGFLMLSFSSNTSLMKVGIFGSLAIFVAFLCDLFLLPALILVFKPKFAKQAVKSKLVMAR